MSWAMPGIVIEMNERMIRYERSFRKFHRKFRTTELLHECPRPLQEDVEGKRGRGYGHCSKVRGLCKCFN